MKYIHQDIFAIDLDKFLNSSNNSIL